MHGNWSAALGYRPGTPWIDPTPNWRSRVNRYSTTLIGFLSSLLASSVAMIAELRGNRQGDVVSELTNSECCWSQGPCLSYYLFKDKQLRTRNASKVSGLSVARLAPPGLSLKIAATASLRLEGHNCDVLPQSFDRPGYDVRSV